MSMAFMPTGIANMRIRKRHKQFDSHDSQNCVIEIKLKSFDEFKVKFIEVEDVMGD